MQNPLDPREEAKEPASEARVPTPAEPTPADRELSLDAPTLPEAVHAYLDGEKVPDQELTAAQRELELWKRIQSEAGRRRRMVTPAYVPQQILKKLSDD